MANNIAAILLSIVVLLLYSFHTNVELVSVVRTRLIGRSGGRGSAGQQQRHHRDNNVPVPVPPPPSSSEKRSAATSAPVRRQQHVLLSTGPLARLRQQQRPDARTSRFELPSKQEAPHYYEDDETRCSCVVNNSSKTTGSSPSSSRVATAAATACCDRILGRGHKMGVFLTDSLFGGEASSYRNITYGLSHVRLITRPDRYFLFPSPKKRNGKVVASSSPASSSSSSEIGVKVRLPAGDFRQVLVLRNIYSSFVSGYLYHLDGRECWKDGIGRLRRPDKRNKPYGVLLNWQDELSYGIEGANKDDGDDDVSLCRYLADSSERDGMRAYVEWAMRYFYGRVYWRTGRCRVDKCTNYTTSN